MEDVSMSIWEYAAILETVEACIQAFSCFNKLAGVCLSVGKPENSYATPDPSPHWKLAADC
jgi:hypothetical protein